MAPAGTVQPRATVPVPAAHRRACRVVLVTGPANAHGPPELSSPGQRFPSRAAPRPGGMVDPAPSAPRTPRRPGRHGPAEGVRPAAAPHGSPRRMGAHPRNRQRTRAVRHRPAAICARGRQARNRPRPVARHSRTAARTRHHRHPGDRRPGNTPPRAARPHPVAWRRRPRQRPRRHRHDPAAHPRPPPHGSPRRMARICRSRHHPPRHHSPVHRRTGTLRVDRRAGTIGMGGGSRGRLLPVRPVSPVRAGPRHRLRHRRAPTTRPGTPCSSRSPRVTTRSPSRRCGSPGHGPRSPALRTRRSASSGPAGRPR